MNTFEGIGKNGNSNYQHGGNTGIITRNAEEKGKKIKIIREMMLDRAKLTQHANHWFS